MRRPWSGDESLLAKLTDNPRARFRAWRQPRPVVGGVTLILGGLLIGYVPLQFASELMLIGGTFTVIGLLFSALVVFCGVAVLLKPQLSTIFGVSGVALSTLSLFGALGGLFVGMLVGTIGGVLCYSWEPPEGYEYEEPALTFQRTEFIWQEASEFIWHAGPDVESTGEASPDEAEPDDGPDSAASSTGDTEPTLDADDTARATADSDGTQADQPGEATADEWASMAEDGSDGQADEWESPTADGDTAWESPVDEAGGEATDADGDGDSEAATGDSEADIEWGAENENGDDEDGDDEDWEESDVVDDRFEL